MNAVASGASILPPCRGVGRYLVQALLNGCPYQIALRERFGLNGQLRDNALAGLVCLRYQSATHTSQPTNPYKRLATLAD